MKVTIFYFTFIFTENICASLDCWYNADLSIYRTKSALCLISPHHIPKDFKKPDLLPNLVANSEDPTHGITFKIIDFTPGLQDKPQIFHVQQ